jgi:hypothetical protein
MKETKTMPSSHGFKWGVLYNADDLPMVDMLRYARMAEEAGETASGRPKAGAMPLSH